jgi:hypothetical protein
MQQVARWFTQLVERDRSVELLSETSSSAKPGMTIRYQGMTWRYLWVTSENAIEHHLMEIHGSNNQAQLPRNRTLD